MISVVATMLLAGCGNKEAEPIVEETETVEIESSEIVESESIFEIVEDETVEIATESEETTSEEESTEGASTEVISEESSEVIENVEQTEIEVVVEAVSVEEASVVEVTPDSTQQQTASNSGYNTIYMENDSAIYYASDDGLTCMGVLKATGEKSPVLYTSEGIKAYYPEIGQVIYNEDGSIKILTCGCCSTVEAEYGITSYESSQATAGSLGYYFDHTEDHPDFSRGWGWIGSTPNSWPHNLCWYYYVK